MNAQMITLSRDRWNELSTEIMECALHATNIALTGLRGMSLRSFRVMKLAENNHLARLELLKAEPDLKSVVDQESDILQRTQDEILEDARNLIQISMFNQDEMRYWFERITGIWLKTGK